MRLTILFCFYIICLSFLSSVIPKVNSKIERVLKKEVEEKVKNDVHTEKIRLQAKVAYCEKVCGLVQGE